LGIYSVGKSGFGISTTREIETRPGGRDDDDNIDIVGDRRTGADPDDFQIGSIPKAGDIGHSVLERTYFSGTGGTAQRGKLRGGQP
jgi:hypothetical protein